MAKNKKINKKMQIPPIDGAEELKELTSLSEEQIMDKSLNAFALYEFMERIEQRRIYLFGDIDTEKIQYVIQQIHVMERRSDDDIELIINSDGGYVSDSLALIDAMDTSLCDVATTVVGVAASAACLIASNGTYGKRSAGRSSDFMYHETYGSMFDVRPSEVRYWHGEFKRTENKCLIIFARNTKKTIKKIKSIFYSTHLDRFMTSTEAKKFGIIDFILPVRRKHSKRKDK